MSDDQRHGGSGPGEITLETPIEIGGLELRNRLYRAPLLEHAGDDDPVDRLIEELEPCV